VTKTLIVGNWKMNLNMHQASLYVHELSEAVTVHRDVEVVLAPTNLTLQSLSLQVKRRQFKLAAQNVYWRDEGAFTGEISAAMVRGIADYVIVGHSERRHIFGETDKDVRAKVQAVLRHGLIPILCVGETANERIAGETKHVLHDQVTGGLANVTSEEASRVIIAYEPVWAIGTGKNATTMNAVEAAQIIRHQVTGLFGESVAEKTRILYGGSVTGDNAGGYLREKEIAGLLVGGASITLQEFTKIIQAGHKE
jgi:triosephosphate isomerase